MFFRACTLVTPVRRHLISLPKLAQTQTRSSGFFRGIGMSERPIKFSSALVIVAGMWGGIFGYLNYEDHRKAELERIEKVLSRQNSSYNNF